jgi:PEP-CTERM motif
VICIAITVAAFEAIAATCPSGPSAMSRTSTRRASAESGYSAVDRLKAMPRREKHAWFLREICGLTGLTKRQQCVFCCAASRDLWARLAGKSWVASRGKLMRMIHGVLHVVALTAAGVLWAVGSAGAQVVSADVGLNESYKQTSNAGPDLEGAFFSARVFFTNLGDYKSGTLTVPTSPTTTMYPLASQGYTPDVEIGYETTGSLSELQAAFPAGNYNFVVNANGSNPEVNLTIPYATPSAYPNVPGVTNYDALNGMNAADSFTVDINGITPSPNATENHIYVDLYSTGGGGALLAEELPLDSTDFIIPAGLLSAGEDYYLDLVYDGRIAGGDDSTPPILVTEFYDIGTEVDFFTAVPEPSTWALMLIGFAGLGFAGYRQRQTLASAASI